MEGNLQKERKSWGRMSQIVDKEGADPKISGHFFKAVVQVVLLFGAETWVLTPRLEQALSRFQNRVARRLIERYPRRRGGGGSWEYPLLAAAMAEAVFEEMRAYVTSRQNMVAQYIAMQPTLDLCERSIWRPGAWVSRR